MEETPEAAAEEVVDDVDNDSTRDLVDSLRHETDASLRLLFHYEGEEYDLAFVRDDVRERFSEPQLEERIETLLLKGLSDPPTQEAFTDFGDLTATMRWFEEVVVAYFPDEEWSGVVAVLDREESPFVDKTVAHLEGED